MIGLRVSADANPLLDALTAYEGEAQYAVASAQRAAAAATARDSRADIARALGIARIALSKQLRPYSRRTHTGWRAKTWLGYGARLWPRQHESIAAAAKRAGYRRHRGRGKLEYLRETGDKLEWFSLDLDTDATRAIIERHGRYHADITYRLRLAREVDRRLRRLGGQARLGRRQIGYYEGRLRRLLNQEIQA